MLRLHVGNGELCSISVSIRAEYLHKLSGILYRRFSLYSTMCLHTYGLKDIYFIFWVIIQYNFVLLLTWLQPWPLGTLGSCVLSTPLLSGTVKCSRLILRISCPSMLACFLLLENDIRTQHLSPLCIFLLMRYCWFWPLSVDRTRNV